LAECLVRVCHLAGDGANRTRIDVVGLLENVGGTVEEAPDGVARIRRHVRE
jgi:hypothetical protein